MNQWLLRRLVGESDDRSKIGQAGSAVGIVVNALLAMMKFIISWTSICRRLKSLLIL